MEYSEFIEYITCHVSEFLSCTEVVNIHIGSVVKNNGIQLDGLTFGGEGKLVSPAIYLNGYYDRYMQGDSLTAIMQEIADLYEENKDRVDLNDAALMDYEVIQSYIFFRLINYERNKEQLEHIPHVRLLDLAVTFRWLAHQDEVGISSALVDNQMMESWRVTIRDLMLAARRNTPRFFPYKLTSMAEALNLKKEKKEDHSLYILSNVAEVNGASCLCYDGVMQAISQKLHSNYYILPSSIHELIIMEDTKEMPVNKISTMVKDANQTVVGPEDYLSDHIYYYDKNSDQISVVI